MGLLNNVLPFVLIVWGQHEIASGLASILNATTPLFTVLAAHALTRDEKLMRLKAVGVVVGFAGWGRDDWSGRSARHRDGGVGATRLSWGRAVVCLCRHFRAEVPQDGGAAACDGGWAGQCPDNNVIAVDASDRQAMAVGDAAHGHVGAVLGVGLLSTVMAYVLYFRILAAAGATTLLLVTVLIPVSAILLGALVLHEALLPRHFAGRVLIDGGLAFVDGRWPLWLDQRDGVRTQT
jgi:hypothetical protein